MSKFYEQQLDYGFMFPCLFWLALRADSVCADCGYGILKCG